MRERTRTLAAASATLLAAVLVWFNYSALLPLIVEDWSLSGFEAGAVFAAFQAGYVVAILPAGRLADRFSTRGVVATGASGTGIASIGFALFARGSGPESDSAASPGCSWPASTSPGCAYSPSGTRLRTAARPSASMPGRSRCRPASPSSSRRRSPRRSTGGSRSARRASARSSPARSSWRRLANIPTSPPGPASSTSACSRIARTDTPSGPTLVTPGSCSGLETGSRRFSSPLPPSQRRTTRR